MLESGLVETDGVWARGRKSLGYRLSDACVTREVEWWEPRDWTLKIKMLRRREKVRIERMEAWRPVHHRLHETQASLGILPEARDYIYANLDDRSRISQLGVYRRIRSHRVSIGVSETTGRVFSVATSAKKAVRAMMTLSGEPMVGLDVKSCQPHLLAILASDRHRAGMIAEFASDHCSDVEPVDASGMVEMLEAGEFYEHLATRAGVSRGEAKHCFMRDAMTVDIRYPSPVLSCFAEDFPEVFQFMTRLRSSTGATIQGILQRLESFVIIERLVAGLSGDHPAVTVHDQVMTTRAGLAELEGSFQELNHELGSSLRHELAV